MFHTYAPVNVFPARGDGGGAEGVVDGQPPYGISKNVKGGCLIPECRDKTMIIVTV